MHCYFSSISRFIIFEIDPFWFILQDCFCKVRDLLENKKWVRMATWDAKEVCIVHFVLYCTHTCDRLKTQKCLGPQKYWNLGE